MTSKERVWSAIRGETPDCQPVIGEDIVIGEKRSEAVSLKSVLSPLTRNPQLVSLLNENPENGNAALQALVDEARSEIEKAVAEGYDGICYVLRGAEPSGSTPMEYGGFFLERDRELLSSVAGDRLTLLQFEGGADAYIDFVSDLPCDIFACEAVHVETLARLRNGAIASTTDGSTVRVKSRIGGSEAAPNPDILEVGRRAATSNLQQTEVR